MDKEKLEHDLKWVEDNYKPISLAPEINIGEIIMSALEKDIYEESKREFYKLLNDKFDFYELSDKEREEHRDEYYDWHNMLHSVVMFMFPDLFLDVHQKVRTDDEVAELYADRWSQLIFDKVIQDNGYMYTESSVNLNMMDSFLKSNVMDKITDDIRKKFRAVRYDGCTPVSVSEEFYSDLPVGNFE